MSTIDTTTQTNPNITNNGAVTPTYSDPTVAFSSESSTTTPSVISNAQQPAAILELSSFSMAFEATAEPTNLQLLSESAGNFTEMSEKMIEFALAMMLMDVLFGDDTHDEMKTISSAIMLGVLGAMIGGENAFNESSSVTMEYNSGALTDYGAQLDTSVGNETGQLVDTTA